MKDECESEPVDVPGESKILEQMRALLRCGAFRSLIDLCAEYKALGGQVMAYGPYLYPALYETGDYDQALIISEECADDVITPADQLKILFRAGRSAEFLRLATSIIENAMWYGFPPVVEALLMRAETYRQSGIYLQAWDDIKGAYSLATEHELAPHFRKDIQAISQRIRMEAARVYVKSRVSPTHYMPRLVGGPTYLGQSSY